MFTCKVYQSWNHIWQYYMTYMLHEYMVFFPASCMEVDKITSWHLTWQLTSAWEFDVFGLFPFWSFWFHRLTEHSQNSTNHTIVHSHSPSSINVRKGVFEMKKMVTLIVILENLLINEVICLILIGTLCILCDIDYN